MIEFTPAAERQADRLRLFYIHENRTGALRSFLAAVQTALVEIERNPAGGKPAPRPYPDVAMPGRAWIKSGRYWFAYSTTRPPVIVGVFFETSDIPNLV